jgi:serine/threonine protein kinase/Flp pilus assembly protein TadD
MNASAADLTSCVMHVLEGYLAELERGVPPDPGQLLARHPDLAEPLKVYLASLEFLHRAALNLRSGDGTREAVAPPAPGELERLGDYEIVREVGRGGMGVVYEAVQVSLGRRVALKVLPFAATLDGRQRQRFDNEARAAALLQHQGIVPVYATGCERGVQYYAMQFIDGQTLAAVIRDLRQQSGRDQAEPRGDRASGGAAPTAAVLSTEFSTQGPDFFRTVANLGVQAARALEHAHQQGVIHRDVKPANLLLETAPLLPPLGRAIRGERLRLWVTDFGLAHCQNQTGLTVTGDLVGTLRYMSPEQALARPGLVDHRTDVYSLGATLYELLTLEPAFDGHDRQELLQQIARDEPCPPRRRNPAVPAELEVILGKAMDKDPAERYATAAEVADDLERYLKDVPIRARRPTLVQRARKWARRHQPAVWSAAVSLLVTVAVSAAAAGWMVRDRAARQGKIAAAVASALDEARRFQGDGKWPQALAAVRRADALLQDGAAAPALAAQVQDLLHELSEKEADAQLIARLEDVRLLQAELNAKEDRFALEESLPQYQRAFCRYGLRADTTSPQEAAARLRRRPPAVRGILVAALDHWLILARHAKAPEAGWLGQVLSAADPDSWRQGVRAARARDDRQALEKLSREVDVAGQPPEALFVLEIGLCQRGATQSAAKLLRRAQEVFPGDFWINHDLGMALQDCQPPQYGEAIRFLTAAVALRPASAGARLNLGRAFLRHGRLDEAVDAFRKAAELHPDYASAHFYHGTTLLQMGQADEALPALRKAVALAPEWAGAHCNLGVVLWLLGQFAQARAALQRGHELGSRRKDWAYPSAQWVQDCQRLMELECHLEAVVSGQAHPANAAEQLDYARLCWCKKLYVAACRFYAGAFTADPKLADDPAAARCYNAACAAALAAAGKGADAGTLDEAERARWRRQALQWLQSALAAKGNRLSGARPEDRQRVRQALRHWRTDPALASLRNPAALATLPADEQQACTKFWAAVEALLARAGAAPDGG